METACCLLHLPHQLVDCTNTSAHYTVHSDSYIATVADCLATAAKILRRGGLRGVFQMTPFLFTNVDLLLFFFL